jgi:Tfp pilus assembly protein PilO
VGRLKFAVDGADAAQISEAEEEVSLLSRHLPDNHNVAQLIEAVKSSGRQGTVLADLYLQRCYHLVHEDYAKLARIEDQLKDFQEQG